jgi:F-type H+-transporting ATPase subunit b
MRALTSLIVALVLLSAAPALAAGGGGEGDHGPGEINWFHGMIGEKEGLKEGNLLFRPKGTPPPFGAWLINTAILFYVVGRFSARPVSDALKKRKKTIMLGIDEAQKMKDDAAARLEDYEEKLAHVNDEIERVKREMREAGEVERERILADARDKRVRVERDARILIEQELKAAREQLLQETVTSAVRSATELLSKQASQQDDERLCQEYLTALDTTRISARGGTA